MLYCRLGADLFTVVRCSIPAECRCQQSAVLRGRPQLTVCNCHLLVI